MAYTKKKENVHANARSRLRTPGEIIVEGDDYIPGLRFGGEENFFIFQMSNELVQDAVGFIDDDDNEQDEWNFNEYNGD